MSSTPKITAFSFNAASVAPQQAFEPVPSDWYSAIITDASLEPTANGGGIRMSIEFTIFDGPFKGRKVFDGLNVQHSNSQAQEIAQSQLSAICHATGVIQISDLTQLYQKPFAAKFGLEEKRTVTNPTTGEVKTYEARNVFKGAKPLSELGGKTATGPAAPSAPAAASLPAGMTPPGWAANKPAAVPSAPPPPVAPVVPPPAPAAERQFYLFFGDQNNIPKMSESQIVAAIATIPAGSHVAVANPDGSNSGKWVPIAQAGLQAPKPAAPAFVPPPAPPAVALPPSNPPAPPVSPAAAFSPPVPAAPGGVPAFSPPWGKV